MPSMFYEKVLRICEKYLTTGAKRFLDRQITYHLKKDPDSLSPADKAELAKWCKTSGKLLLGEEKAEQLAREILGA